MAFDNKLVEEILKRADIVDVISSYINVIKKGKNYLAICPFHDDHHPSMSISREKQIYKCYSCGNGGNVITFVMNYEHVKFFDALKKIAEIIGYDDPRLHETIKVVPTNPSLDVLYDCSAELTKFYQYALSTDEGKVARDYLDARSLGENIRTKFCLGYAFNDGRLTIEYLTKKGFSLKNIENIGIALARHASTTDNNAGRLIFPLFDLEGRPVGYSARRLIDDKSLPKYVNSPETSIFHKSNLLYNFHNASQTCRRDGYIYVVEGFMDVFAIDEIGISSVVALMGTALTKEHLQLLKRTNVEVRLCLDGDVAGKSATMKAIKELDEARIPHRIVYMDNELRDPDEILRGDGPDKLRFYLNNLTDAFNFSLAYYINTSPIDSPEAAKEIIKSFVPLFANITDQLSYDNYLYKLSEATHYDARALRTYLASLVTAYRQKKVVEEESIVVPDVLNLSYTYNRQLKGPLRRLLLIEDKMLQQMVLHEEAVNFYEQNIKYFFDEVNRMIANFLIDYLENHEKLDLSEIVAMVEESDVKDKEEIKKKLTDIAYIDAEPYSEEMLVEYKKIIDEQKQKIYERKRLEASLKETTSESDKARIIRDYNKMRYKDFQQSNTEDDKDEKK